MNYKVGDKVRFIDEEKHMTNHYYNPPVGTIGTIVNIDPFDDGRLDIKVEWGEESGVIYNESDECYAWWVSRDAIVPFDGLNKSEEEVEDLSLTEAVDTEPVVESIKFKVGDRVRYILKKKELLMNGFRWYPDAGTIGIIIEINNDNLLINWGENSGVSKNSNGEYEWFCRKDRVELVTEMDDNHSDDKVFEDDDAAVLAELVIKKQIEIKKLKEDNARLLARNTVLNNMVTCFRNLGFQILNVGTDINIGVNKNV